MKTRTLIMIYAAILGYFLIGIIACQSPKVDTQEPKPSVGIKLKWNNEAWDSALFSAVGDSLASFDKAKDWELFCPGYYKMPSGKRIVAISTMAVAIAKFESGYKPGTVFKESNGVDSIGLFQLSYGDSFCPKSKADGDLKDGIVNIKCAVKIMARWADKDGVLADGGYVSYGAQPARGLARYWSVLRSPDKKSKHHLAEIRSMTKLACQ